jgi:hypothetical protein
MSRRDEDPADCPTHDRICAQTVATGVRARYDGHMPSRQIESRPERTPILRKAVAGLVLLGVAALVIHVAIGLVLAVFWVVLGLVAVAAVLWALNALL